MALNDYREKLATAEAFLLQYSPASQEFDAALEHVLWTYKYTELRDASKAVMQRVVMARRDEKATMDKLRNVVM